MGGRTTDDERRRGLLEASEKLTQSGSWDWVPSDGELLWSDNLFRIFGLEPGEITPSTEWVVEHTHPDDAVQVAERIEELASGGDWRPMDYRVVRPDGLIRHLRATLAVAETREGRPHRFVGTLQDLTDLQHKDRQISAHLAVADALSEWVPGRDGVARLLARLAEAMDFVVGVLWVPDGQELTPRVFWGAPRIDVPAFEAATRDARLPCGEGAAGEAWETREPVGRRSASAVSPFRRGQAASEEGLHGVLAIPVVNGQEVLAVFEFVAREEIELTARLQHSLTGISHEIGQFLAHHRGELEASPLTPRELEVLELAAQGLSARESAERLVVSAATITTHLEHIYRKLGVSSKASATAKALRDGLIG